MGQLLAAYSRSARRVIAIINTETQRTIYSDIGLTELKGQYPDLELECAPRAVEIVEDLYVTDVLEVSVEEYEAALEAASPLERAGTTFLARQLICG